MPTQSSLIQKQVSRLAKFIKANYRITLMALALPLSGCLQTMQPTGAKQTTTQQSAQQEKAAGSLEKSSTPAAKPQPSTNISNSVAQRETVRAAANTNEQQTTAKLISATTSSVPATKSQKSSFSRGKEISCTPDVVRPGDTLVVKTSKGYPAFGVRVPDKNVGFLLLTADAYPEGLIDNKKFSQQMGININVAEAKIKPNTRIFTKEGIYGFVVSQNLETDDGTPAFECKVKYIAK